MPPSVFRSTSSSGAMLTAPVLVCSGRRIGTTTARTEIDCMRRLIGSPSPERPDRSGDTGSVIIRPSPIADGNPMKAVVCRQFGPPESLVVEELPSPRPGAGEVVVSMKAASVNFPDVLIIQNKYQFKPPLPFSPGSEMAGVVKEVGEGVSDCRPGDRVIAFTAYGAFAEEVKVDAGAPGADPRGHGFRERGRLPADLRHLGPRAARPRGAARPARRCWCWARPAASASPRCEIGKALGARVIACASSADKLEVCRRARRGRGHQLRAPKTCASASRT